MTDPTRYEILRSIVEFKELTKGLHDWSEDNSFSIESAIYYFANHWHNGQWSNLYSVLSISNYRPGMMENFESWSEEDYLGNDIYQFLESKWSEKVDIYQHNQ